MIFSRPSTPLWDDSTAMPEFQPLATNTGCEVAIIGAGITGLSADFMQIEFRPNGLNAAPGCQSQFCAHCLLWFSIHP